MNQTRDRKADLHKLAEAFFEHLTIVNIEFGGIGLDPKRPFGFSWVEGSILEIIGWEPEDEDDEFTGYQKSYAYELYHNDLIPYLKELWETKMAG